MGVIPYNITFKVPKKKLLQQQIDSLLNSLNEGSSTYEENSVISRFNRSEKGITIINEGPARHFLTNLIIAKEVFEKSDGYFDPTVAPLVKYYGFYDKKGEGIRKIDSTKVKELLTLVGLDKIQLLKENDQYSIRKENPGIQLDFSAIAKGYAIDEVARFLELNDIFDYLVEIGGEVRAKGKNSKGRWWKIGIKKPTQEASKGYFMGTPELKNQAMATSGNYESFKLINGVKMGHTLNPKTGFPELNPLLSASVFSEHCIIADSYATAFMSMGKEKALTLVEELPEISAYLVYIDLDGKIRTVHTKEITEIF